eukprot:CAMPEP_0195014480 /NCGR_PEP_ID=MMETSP0326_2-20130528/16116_1 /TAXON_ID=2866 ORGANISM="Crypthecodinium cohnii, Strain Seligo" /NCGR_SAMPLE_ID=MMETSP0326_2 /ASSEMBLY_ACC=CAM_ASM_000348 /LENGTH=60 /DNA_ID=CAMNT_0040027199 /DNA_START=304 /DNA_END=483 /DNA_ORIENTATION=+
MHVLGSTQGCTWCGPKLGPRDQGQLTTIQRSEASFIIGCGSPHQDQVQNNSWTCDGGKVA